VLNWIKWEINDLLSVASADTVKSVWYSLHVNIPRDRTCKPERASEVFVRARKDGSSRYNSVCLICSCHTVAHKNICVYRDLYWTPSLCDVMCDVMWRFVLAVVYGHLLPISWLLMDPIPLWCDVWHNVVFCLGGIYYWFCSRIYVLYVFPGVLPSHSVFDYPLMGM